jgi:hypothetical protein
LIGRRRMVKEALKEGAVVVVDARVRVRLLPIE